jgi:hypothetical protein
MLAPAAMQNDAVNDCVWPSATLAEEGEMEFVDAQVIVALALADFELSAEAWLAPCRAPWLNRRNCRWTRSSPRLHCRLQFRSRSS